MEYLLILLSALLLLIGIVGIFLPAIPGLPLMFLGVLCLHFSGTLTFSLSFMIFWGLLILLVTIIDFILPGWVTKRRKGSNMAAWGSVIGLILGIIFTPIGMIFGTFLGAFVGEYLYSKNTTFALEIGITAMVTFLLGTIFKVVVALAFIGSVLWLSVENLLPTLDL